MKYNEMKLYIFTMILPAYPAGELLQNFTRLSL